jgi:hypothetical protein
VTPRRLQLVLALALGVLALLALAAPLVLAGGQLRVAWWALAGIGLAAALVQASLLWRGRHDVAPRPLQPKPAAPLDFDSPWRGGKA